MFKLTESLFAINHSNTSKQIVSAAVTEYLREGSAKNMIVSSANNVKCSWLEMYVMSIVYNKQISWAKNGPLRHTTYNLLYTDLNPLIYTYWRRLNK